MPQITDSSAIIIGVLVGVALTLCGLVVIASVMRGAMQSEQLDTNAPTPNQPANSSIAPASHVAVTATLTTPQQIADINLSTRKLLSYQEAAFLKTLRKASGRRYIIAMKVRLNDVFSTRQELGNDLFRMYMNGHIDFLLVHPLSWEPVAGIELDDSTHQTPGARERDVRKDVLFHQAKLPIKRFLLNEDVDVVRQWVMGLGSDKFIEAREQSIGDENEE